MSLEYALEVSFYDFVVSITLTLACFCQNPGSFLLVTLYIASLFLSPVAKDVQFHKVVQHKEHADCE